MARLRPGDPEPASVISLGYAEPVKSLRPSDTSTAHADIGRRIVLRAAGGIALAAAQMPALARVVASATAEPSPTPRLTDGPFYPVAFDRNPTTSLIVGPLL